MSLGQELLAHLPTDINPGQICPACKLSVSRLVPVNCLAIGVCARCCDKITAFHGEALNENNICMSCFANWPTGDMWNKKVELHHMRLKQVASIVQEKARSREAEGGVHKSKRKTIEDHKNIMKYCHKGQELKLPEWCRVDAGAQVYVEDDWEDCTILEFYGSLAYVHIDDGENIETELDSLRDPETRELAKERKTQILHDDISRGEESQQMMVIVPGGRFADPPPSEALQKRVTKLRYIKICHLQKTLYDVLPLVPVIGKCFGCDGVDCDKVQQTSLKPDFGTGPKCSKGAYVGNRLARSVYSLMECNCMCRCNYKTCTNRVVQKGITKELEIVWVNGAWALRCQQRIKKGEFICEFVGIIGKASEPPSPDIVHLPGAEAWINAITHNACSALEDRQSTIPPDQKAHIESCSRRCEHILMVDARRYGNVGKFVRVLSDDRKQNVDLVWVWVDNHDPLLPRVGMFAKRDVKAGEILARGQQPSRVLFDDMDV